jgi:hypothetical protein
MARRSGALRVEHLRENEGGERGVMRTAASLLQHEDFIVR